ncbi:MAG: hypothetical protein ACXWX6_02940 [Actinomycetota bacterium]
MPESTGRSTPIAAILTIAGGALLAVGSFLAWAEVSGGGTSVTAKGTDGTDGWITFVAGLIVLAVGAAFIRGGGNRALAILAIVAALVGGGVGLYDALTAKDRVLDDAAEELAGQFGGTAAEVRALLDQAIDAGELGISLSIGLYLVIAGGALGIVGGFMGMKGSTAAPAMPAMGSMPAAAPAPPMTAPPTTAPPTTAPPAMPEPPAPGDPSAGGS